MSKRYKFAWATYGVGLVMTAACASPTRPAQVVLTAMITVETRVHNSRGEVLPGVTVRLDGRYAGITDEAGMVTFTFPAGEHKVGVEKDGWTPFIPSATGEIQPGSHERWMFALEKNK